MADNTWLQGRLIEVSVTTKYVWKFQRLEDSDMSVVERCPYSGGVRMERFYCMNKKQIGSQVLVGL